MSETTRPPHSRLFVVCGRGVAESELRDLFSSFGEVRSVRVLGDKGVAYVKFARASAAARALETVGDEPDGEGALEGGVATTRRFLGGCERLLRVMLADDANAQARTRTAADTSPAASPATSSAATHAHEDPEDEPPRSRLFVVCPKGVSQDVLHDGFRDLLAGFARDDAARDDARDRDPAAVASPSQSTSNDTLVSADLNTIAAHPSDLESVRVVPHKGVAFAKFARASAAARCMEAVTATGTLGGVRVKCMLAEPRASRDDSGAGVGANGD